MIRRVVIVAALALAHCTADGNVPVLCENDAACPFEQCCVQGACVDPGPGGACGDAAIESSTLVVTPSTIVAGTTADVRITVRDTYGRPIPSSSAEVLIQSSCTACDTITSENWTSDANGNIAATFTSTGSGTKVLTLRVGSTLATPTLVQVVPDVAVSVGFASAIADTPIGQPLQQVAVTRLDIYGNPDALPTTPTELATKVEIQLEVNAAGMQLVDASGAPIPSSARTFTLDQTRVPIDGLHVPFVAYNQRLVAFDASETPSLAASQSNAFDITVPHITSTTPDVLSAKVGAPATLEWQVAPADTTTLIHEADTAEVATSPYPLVPKFIGETPSLTHIRVRPAGASATLDLEAARMGITRAFSPSPRNGSQVNILDLKRFPNGDVLVVGSFTYDMRLGTRGDSVQVVTAVLQTGLEGFIARFDPLVREVKWVSTFYGVESATRGVNVVIKDTDITSGDVVAIAEFAGAGAGWRYDVAGAGGQLAARQCTVGSAEDATSWVVSVARIDGVSGAVEWCSGIHDADPKPVATTDPKITNTRAGVVASLDATTSYVAVRLVDNVKLYAGRLVANATPEPRIDGAGAVLANITKAFPAEESGNCAGGYTALIPMRANGSAQGTLDATRDVIATGIAFEPTSITLDANRTGFTVSGNGCSNGGASWDLELGRTQKVVTALRPDGMVLRVNTPLATAAGERIALLYQTRATHIDRIWEARPYLNDIVIVGDYTVSMPFNDTTIDIYGTGATTYVARIRPSGPPDAQIAWYRLLGSRGGNVTPYGLSISGDRIVATVQSVDEVVLVGSPHMVIDMNDEIPDPVGMLFELDGDGEPRWSSPFLGTTRPSHPLAMTGGSVMLGLCGLQGSVIGAALDAVPLRQTIQRGGRYEPILGLYTPFDFIVRDIVKAP